MAANPDIASLIRATVFAKERKSAPKGASFSRDDAAPLAAKS
jgi:hypothetical protein